ncbi:hypothetical protein [Streptosporangium sp. NPDC002524]|uniref:hypothetical protein n=1 Tax=Streptosporangium sp. NPDC002524 TaxID=3154537 RepID=UPI00331BA030
MAVLKYEDLVEDVKRELAAKGLEFHAKDGETVTLRPVLLLGKEELKVVTTLLNVVSDEGADTFARIEAMDAMLIASADKKKSLKNSLDDLPPQIRTRVFDAWMKAGNGDALGEASA